MDDKAAGTSDLVRALTELRAQLESKEYAEEAEEVGALIDFFQGGAPGLLIDDLGDLANALETVELLAGDVRALVAQPEPEVTDQETPGPPRLTVVKPCNRQLPPNRHGAE